MKIGRINTIPFRSVIKVQLPKDKPDPFEYEGPDMSNLFISTDTVIFSNTKENQEVLDKAGIEYEIVEDV